MAPWTPIRKTLEINDRTVQIELIEKMRAFSTLQFSPEKRKIESEIMEIIQNRNIDVNGKYLENLPILIRETIITSLL